MAVKEIEAGDSVRVAHDDDTNEATWRRVAEALIDSWKGGRSINLKSVLSDHPDICRHKSIVMDLAYEEFCQRKEQGESVSVGQFCDEFPVFQTSLRQQLEIHELMGDKMDVFEKCAEIAFPEVGDEFLGFDIVENLGRGSFGRVFRAKDRALGERDVAIKVAPFGGAEAETLGKLDHTSIVPIHSVKEDDLTGVTAICMPYLGRATLSDVLDDVSFRGKRPERAADILEAVWRVDGDGSNRKAAANRIMQRGSYVEGVLQIGLQLTEALAHAHSRGILHLDIKPSNILVTSDGVPMLLDFNLAFDREKDQMRVGGTLPYMSPEQLKCLTGDVSADSTVDEKSDIFAIGAIMYVLLTGKLPFGKLPEIESTTEQAREMLNQRELGIAASHRGLTRIEPGVFRIIERCLAFESTARLQSADELVAALRKELSYTRRTMRWVSVHPVRSSLVALFISLLIGGSAAFYATLDPYSVRQLNYGIAAYQQGDYERSVFYLNRSIADNSDLSDAYLMRCRVHAKLRDFESAKLDAEVIKSRNENGELLTDLAAELMNVGIHFFEQEEYELALEYFELVLVVTPRSSAAFFWCGRARVEMGIIRFVADDPNYRDTFKLAMEDVHKSIQIKDDPEKLALYGYCCSITDNHGSAVSYYEKAIQAGVDSPEMRCNTALSHYRDRNPRYASAQREINLAIEMGGNQQAFKSRALMDLAQARKHERELTTGVADMRRALNIAPPSSLSLLRSAADLFFYASQYDEKHIENVIMCIRTAMKYKNGLDYVQRYPHLRDFIENHQDDLGEITSPSLPLPMHHPSFVNPLAGFIVDKRAQP